MVDCGVLISADPTFNRYESFPEDVDTYLGTDVVRPMHQEHQEFR